jgi:surface antigen
MPKWIRHLVIVLVAAAVLYTAGDLVMRSFYKMSLWHFANSLHTESFKEGQVIDSFNHVIVYYNGNTHNVFGLNTTPDGYNLGYKYQCVEFVKRYYYQHYHHKMPNVYGNACDFFMAGLPDGAINTQRNLRQCLNGGHYKPKPGDLVVFKAIGTGSYGHVAIIYKVTDDKVELIQQNPGPHVKSRVFYGLSHSDNNWHIESDRVAGWLRMRKG